MQIEPEIAGWWETTGAAPFVGIYIYFTLHWEVLQGGQGLLYPLFKVSLNPNCIGRSYGEDLCRVRGGWGGLKSQYQTFMQFL